MDIVSSIWMNERGAKTSGETTFGLGMSAETCCRLVGIWSAQETVSSVHFVQPLTPHQHTRLLSGRSKVSRHFERPKCRV